MDQVVVENRKERAFLLDFESNFVMKWRTASFTDSLISFFGVSFAEILCSYYFLYAELPSLA